MAEEKAGVYQRLLTAFRRSLVRDRVEKLLVQRVSCAPGALTASVGIPDLMTKHCAFTACVQQLVNRLLFANFC